MPLIQSNSTVHTFQDCVEQLLDLHELDVRTPVHERRARASILQAYRDLPTKHSWNYYYRTRLIQTVASYSTGTITFDYTGGSSELLVTLASGTFPTWAAFGRIIIDDVPYEVNEYLTSTTLTLRSDSNPGQDVAAGTAYEIYRSAYPLPSDFASLVRIWDVEDERPMVVVDPAQYQAGNMSFYDSPQQPWEVMIRSTGEHYGGLHLHFGPPPDAIRSYELLYRVHPRPLNIDEYSVGSVTVSSGSTTVTGSGTIFPTNCVGSVIRFSGNTKQPSSVAGSLDGADNPFIMQSVIKTRTSDTALVLEEAATTAIAAGSGYVISDPVDLESGAMFTAFMRLAEAEFCLKAGRKDATLRQSMAMQAIRDAMAADSRCDNVAQIRGYYNPFTHTTIQDGEG